MVNLATCLVARPLLITFISSLAASRTSVDRQNVLSILIDAYKSACLPNITAHNDLVSSLSICAALTRLSKDSSIS